VKSLPWWGVAAFLLVAMDFDNIDIEDIIGASVTERDVEPQLFEETARRLAEEGWYKPDPDEFDFSATSPPSEFQSTSQPGGAHSEDGHQIVEGTTNLTVKQVKVRHGALVLPFQSPAQILANHSLQVTVPCLAFLTFQLITPCGNLSLPREGITFSTAFGKYTMPGADFLQNSLRKTERELSQYTVLFIILCCVSWCCYTFLIKSNRERFFDKMREICSGRLIYHDHEDDVDDDEESSKNPLHHDEQKARLDPMSPEFIAPGNIYRLLAVLHPGIIGFRAWGGYAFRAAIVAYMQLWMPFQIITNTFKRWRWLGIKSPLWFLANAGTFVAMVTALGSLCGMFAARCTSHIYRGAEANMYILSHYNPGENDSKRSSIRSSMSSQQAPLHLDHWEASVPSLPASTSLERVARVAGAQETLDGAYTTINEGIGTATGTVNKGIDTVNKGINDAYATYSRIEKPRFSRWAIDLNEFIWCNVAMSLNVLMSVMLEFCMFLKVATYTGRIGNVAMTAVSLYFIFDLDDRIMEADPKLRQKYRRAVAAQTEPKLKEHHPWMIPTIASLSAAFVNLTVPIGLVGIVLIAWKREKDGFVIGGDGLTTV